MDNEKQCSSLVTYCSSTMVFSNFAMLGSIVLFIFRLTLMVHLLYPLMYDLVFITGPELYEHVAQRVNFENSNLLKVACKMVFDRICAINPEPYVILHVLLKSVIIKGSLKFFKKIFNLILNSISPLCLIVPRAKCENPADN